MHTYILIFQAVFRKRSVFLRPLFFFPSGCGAKLIPGCVRSSISHSKLFTCGCIIINLRLNPVWNLDPRYTFHVVKEVFFFLASWPLAHSQEHFLGNSHRHIHSAFICWQSQLPVRPCYLLLKNVLKDQRGAVYHISISWYTWFSDSLIQYPFS